MSTLPIEGADGASLSYSDFAHLTPYEWDALRRLANVSGITVVTAMLFATSQDQQRAAIQEFMTRELAEMRRRASTPAASPKADVVKLNVSNYNGEAPGRLALNRWLCEVDIAIHARQLSSELARTHFLLSKLNGRAKEWALGRLVTDSDCFPTLGALKADLRLAFEPPQDEMQHRSAFLALKQGRVTMRDYIQRARHLASSVVTSPTDMATQVHVFIAGMNAGHQRLYLTWKPPGSLEEAFAVALRESYSVVAARSHHVPSTRVDHDAEAMEVDAIEHTTQWRGASNRRARPTSTKQLTCFRCRKIGHRAAVCRAPAPVLAAVDALGELDETAYPKNAGHQYSVPGGTSDCVLPH